MSIEPIRPVRTTLALLALAAGAAQVHAQAAADPRGRWITASGNLEVEIAPCGSALCGTVTRVLGNRSMAPGGGEMKPADSRPALGMRLLDGFEPSAGGSEGQPVTEWRGTIYNRENGKTYRCTMSLGSAHDAAGELLLRAYVGLPIFGQTQAWRRAPAPPAAEATASTAVSR